LWAAARGPAFATIVCGAYGGIELDVECDYGSGSVMTGFLVGSRDNEDLIGKHLLFADGTLIFLWCPIRTNLTSAMYLLML
jgi:hypothetical protein